MSERVKLGERVRFRPIGDVFVDGQGRTLKVQETDSSTCKGCVNYPYHSNLSCLRLKDYSGLCSDVCRDDGKNVIFVEVEGGKNG